MSLVVGDMHPLITVEPDGIADAARRQIKARSDDVAPGLILPIRILLR